MSGLIKYTCGITLILILGLIGFFSFPWLSFDRKGYKILNGEFTSHYEKDFDEILFHTPWSTSFWQSVNYFLFGEVVKGALIGNDGWLFTDEEFLYSDEFLENVKYNQKYVLSVTTQLKQMGIETLVVPIPSKARLIPEQLGRYKFPVYKESTYKNFLLFLKNKDINFIDLYSVFQNHKAEKVFFKTDTHWTPQGARLAAKNIAQMANLKFPQETFISKEINFDYFLGDLMKYTSERLFDEEGFTLWKTIKVKSNTEDLFSKQYFPVVLIGTSYSADARWNFDGFLKEYLQTDVLNFSDKGVGPFAVMDNYLKEYDKKAPKLVIWEIPERYLSMSFSSIGEQK